MEEIASNASNASMSLLNDDDDEDTALQTSDHNDTSEQESDTNFATACMSLLLNFGLAGLASSKTPSNFEKTRWLKKHAQKAYLG